MATNLYRKKRDRIRWVERWDRKDQVGSWLDGNWRRRVSGMSWINYWPVRWLLLACFSRLSARKIKFQTANLVAIDGYIIRWVVLSILHTLQNHISKLYSMPTLISQYPRPWSSKSRISFLYFLLFWRLPLTLAP